MSFRYEVNEQDLYSSFPFPTQLSAQMSDVGGRWAGHVGMSLQEQELDAASSLETRQEASDLGRGQDGGTEAWAEQEGMMPMQGWQTCVWLGPGAKVP